MQFRWIKVVLAIVSLSVGASAADSSIGTWKLNVAKSKYSPGPPPKSVTLKYETAGDGVKLSVERIDEQGKATSGGYTAKYDGKDVPYAGTGGPLGAETVALKRIDASTVEATFKRGGKVIATARGVVSADGKTRTITTTGTNEQGQKVHNVAVYDKQ